MKRPRVHDVFDPPIDDGVDCGADSLPPDAPCRGARQDGKDDADINVIMARAAATGGFPPMMQEGDYLDVSDMPEDYMQARLIVEDAAARFAGLPPNIRSRFANDPYNVLAFLADPANRKEAQELGLIITPAEAGVAKGPTGDPMGPPKEEAPRQPAQ